MSEKIKKLPRWAQEEFSRQRIAGTSLWPKFEKPTPVDVAHESKLSRLVVGWFAGFDSAPTQGCSNGYGHSRSNTNGTTTRGAGVMYKTRLDALKATRWEMAERAAESLAHIDAMIEEASDE